VGNFLGIKMRGRGKGKNIEELRGWKYTTHTHMKIAS
jgi:hypothetical protein